MSSEDRDSSGSDSEGEGPNMMNFMFGNVDADGNLEGDFLDEVCCTSQATYTVAFAQGLWSSVLMCPVLVQETKQQLAGLQNSKEGLDIAVCHKAVRFTGYRDHTSIPKRLCRA